MGNVRGGSAPPGQGRLDLADRPYTDSLDAAVEEVIFEAADTGFAVVKVTPEGASGASLRAAGELAGVVPGESIRLRGRYKQHPRHGLQFEAEAWEPLEPRTTAGLEKYLGSGLVKGVGKALAKKIVRHLGPDTLRIAVEEPKRLREVRCVGPRLAERIAEAITAHRAEAETIAFLRAYGLGPSLARRVLEEYGDDAKELLSRDPYRLAEQVRGIGFHIADRMARELGVASDSPARAEAAVLHVLGQGRDAGHVGMPLGLVVEQAEGLGVPRGVVDLAIPRLADRGAAVLDEGLLFLPALHRCEVGLARALRRLGGARSPAPREVEMAGHVSEKLAPEQADAVAATLSSGLVVITGGPGTGKTTTLRAVVALHERLDARVALAAPTGRAARRLAEVTRRPAQTVHRLLEYNPKLGFQRSRAAPLEADVVVVDEASMLDVSLSYRLTDAVPPEATLVLVGDVDQLPSVGPGRVLDDVIEARAAAVVRLSHVFRQAAESGIVANAHRVNGGAPPRSGGSGGAPDDFHVIRSEDPERALDLLAQLVCERIPEAYGLDPVDDVQVLAPMYKGTLGCDAINARLRERLNPGSSRGLRGLRIGDKVMQVRNDYDREVFNGDLGRVAAALPDSLVVEVDGRRVDYDAKAAEDLKIAYCATVHKSQGSEYPAVVVAIHRQHHVMLARNLLYTAITRGKQLVVLLGSLSAMARAAQNDRRAARHGLLRQRLSGTLSTRR